MIEGSILLLIVLAFVLLAGRRIVRTEVVYPWQAALLYRNGRFDRVLPDGRHRLFDPWAAVMVVRLSAVDQHLRLAQMDVVSADQFAFRIHLTLDYRLTDPRAAYEAQIVGEYGEPVGLADRIAAEALVVVGGQPIDAVLTDGAAIADAISARLAGQLPYFDIAALRLIRIDLPPETRRMLTEAERARREGQATLERARAEQASLRALANAARLVKDNPELARLRLLRTIEDNRGPTTIVVGDPRAVSPA